MNLPKPPKDEFVLYATLQAKPTRGNDLERYLRVLVGFTKTEPGVLDYVIGRDDEDGDVFHVYERYTGADAFEFHIASREFQDFAGADLLVRPPAPKMLKPLKPL